jgi:hypothetical protein
MLNNYKNLINGNLNNVDNNMLYPLLRWCSSSIYNISEINNVNKLFFYSDKEMMKGLMFLSLKMKQIDKYPKGIKEENEQVFELKKQLIKQYFKWSENEFNKNINVIQFLDIKYIALSFGYSEKELKLLNINYEIKNINGGSKDLFYFTK